MNKISIRILFPAIITVTLITLVLIMITISSDHMNTMLYRQSKDSLIRQSSSLAEVVSKETVRIIDCINDVYYRILKNSNLSMQEKEKVLKSLCDNKNLGIVNICLHDSNGNLLLTSGPHDMYSGSNMDFVNSVKKHSGKIFFEKTRISCRDDSIISVIPVSCLVEIFYEGRIIDGFLQIEFSAANINAIMESYGSTEDAYCYLLNDNNEIAFHPYKQKIENRLGSEWSLDYLDGEHRFFTHNDANGKEWLIGINTISYSGWKVVLVNSFDKVQEKEFLSFFMIWWLIIIFGIIIAIVDILLFKELSNPISTLAKGLAEFSVGNMKIKVPEKGIGELRELEIGFNSMVRRIDKMMNKILANEKDKRHMERRLLQAQISPHFLYNTLDSIIWMIQGKQYEGAEKMVYLLAKFFRIALSKGHDVIPLEQELQHAISYLSIQGIRFHDKFEVIVDVDESLNQYLCPKVTLQPILENAIYHGMDGMYGDGEISIKVYSVGENICLEVSDNGSGMTEEQIEALMKHNVKSTGKGSGIGVANVDERIKLIFGEEYGISITSELDEGTIVRIIIPRVVKDDV